LETALGVSLVLSERRPRDLLSPSADSDDIKRFGFGLTGAKASLTFTVRKDFCYAAAFVAIAARMSVTNSR
jgi:hypothetical protein